MNFSLLKTGKDRMAGELMKQEYTWAQNAIVGWNLLHRHYGQACCKINEPFVHVQTPYLSLMMTSLQYFCLMVPSSRFFHFWRCRVFQCVQRRIVPRSYWKLHVTSVGMLFVGKSGSSVGCSMLSEQISFRWSLSI